jgi:undecaprenyl-diphosphatase
MMTIIQAIILGIIQGLTEYIPVSSTAHLILVPWLFGWQTDPVTTFVFSILIQWGTLVGVIVYFWRDLLSIAKAMIGGLMQRKPFESWDARLGWFVVLATIPAVIAGLLLKKYFEQLYTQYVIIAIIMIAAAGLLIAAERFTKKQRVLESMTAKDAAIIGTWQVLALAPGVSRSSATISGGMFQNFMREPAARFSFLMSIPALLGAGVVAIKDLLEVKGLLGELALPLAVGFITAAISGYFSIRWLLGFLKSRSMNVFAIYRIVFGGIYLVVALAQLR